TDIGVRITITQDSITGTSVYNKTSRLHTNSEGIAVIEIGGSKAFEHLNWSDGVYFLQSEIDPTGGEQYTMYFAARLLNISYALYSKTVDFNDLIHTATSIRHKFPSIEDELEYWRLEQLWREGKAIRDSDGNIYRTVHIGSQVWLADNVRSTHYTDGTNIEMENLQTKERASRQQPEFDNARCFFDKNRSNSGKNPKYGYLYNWVAATHGKNCNYYETFSPVLRQGVCPTGWHVPNLIEWEILLQNLGGSEIAGGKLKSTTYWNAPNKGATNESGFNAIATGLFEKNEQGEMQAQPLGENTGFWTATQHDAHSVYVIYLDSYTEQVEIFTTTKHSGYAIRCIKN
ncbi:MAG: hypothetical protein LBR55_00990, partial [Bacteroidales bacterium]|nr:hypothetical protein [Bacteroidales bacterium]